MTYGPPRGVDCAWCGYRDMVVTPDWDNADGTTRRSTQGDNVASVCYERNGEWFILGCYGSTRFDLDKFRFVKNAPTERANPVCDDCIQKRIDDGDIVQVPGQFP